MNAGVLQPDGVQHAGRRVGDSGRRVPEAGFQRRPLERQRAEDIDVVQFRELVPVAERAARGDDRVVERNPGERNPRIQTITSFFSSTGPSLQMRLFPYFVRHEQPMHAPKPQPIRCSKLNCPSASVAACTARSIGSGPQA